MIASFLIYSLCIFHNIMAVSRCQEGGWKFFSAARNRRGIFIPAKSQISLSCSWDGYGIFSGSGDVPGLEKGRERQNFSGRERR